MPRRVKEKLVTSRPLAYRVFGGEGEREREGTS